MQLTRGLIAIGALALAGCNLSTDLPTNRRLGLFTVNQSGAVDNALLDVNALFFQPGANDQIALPNSAAVPDNCVEADYAPPVDGVLRKLDNLNAGESIAMTTDKADTVLRPVTNSVGTVIYVVPGGGFVPFTPGSDVTFEIPGDPSGYPADTIKIRTLEPLTLAAVERKPTNELHLSWSPVGSAGGGVRLQFLYSSDSSATPNKSLNCDLRDDGEFDIPGFVTDGWASSPAEAQSIVGFRWATLIRSQQDVVLHVTNQVQINPPTFTDN
ncbi:MAG TPA: hypothetical protein VIQ74_01890 [Gemmatimonadaceae bacterium]|jgi:hypothetical protein